jgi:hypothetical protein
VVGRVDAAAARSDQARAGRGGAVLAVAVAGRGRCGSAGRAGGGMRPAWRRLPWPWLGWSWNFPIHLYIHIQLFIHV